MIESNKLPTRLFHAGNLTFLALLSVSCLFPLIHILAVSFSSRASVSGGLVTIWPIGFNLDSYESILNDKQYMRSFGISVARVAVGTIINMILIVITAYPLIKRFRGRTFFVWYMVFTMLFSGGLIPTFMVIKDLGLINSFWSMIWPGAVQVFSIILMMNFFKAIPKEMDEAAAIDGASNFQALFSIYFPMSLPAVATLTLFASVNHWNSFFDAILYINRIHDYPLQAYLQSKQVDDILLIQEGLDAETLNQISDRSLRAARIFVGTLPILLVYPLLQKHFVKGIVIGSVKE